MKIYFKIRAVLDPRSVEELTTLSEEELYTVYDHLSSTTPEVEFLCSLEDDDTLEVLSINDSPVIENQYVELFGGKVTRESKYQ